MDTNLTLEEKLAKRLCKDYSLPIQIFKEPYWSYFINLYNTHYQSVQKVRNMQNLLEKFKSANEFLDHNGEITRAIIDHVKNSKGFSEFYNLNLQEFSFPIPIRKDNIYIPENSGKRFIEIDIKKANFVSMRYVVPDIFGNHESYESLVSEFTDSDYIKTSKYIRQIIFGNLNPKRQQAIQKGLIAKIMGALSCNLELQVADFVSTSSDELTLVFKEDLLDNIVETLQKEFGSLSCNFRVHDFELRRIGKTSYYVKQFKDPNNFDIKLVPSKIFAQAYKFYVGDLVTESDLYFWEESTKQTARFASPINFYYS